MKKNLLTALIFIAFSISAFCFEWPQTETMSDSFYSYFGQLRGGTVANSLIFKENSEIKACDDGTIIAVISEHDDDFGWFESTLGNAVIISHNNNLATVYANLDGETVPEEIASSQKAYTGMNLGVSGNSGWQESQSCLEFQVFDAENSSSINPRILMPRNGDELPVECGEVTLVDRNGVSSVLKKSVSVQPGVYTIYHTRQKVAVPYRTSVLINGVVMETVSFDVLKEYNGKLCIHGNTYYPLSMLYPDEERQLLSQLHLTSGLNKISISIYDILGNVKTSNYSVEVK